MPCNATFNTAWELWLGTDAARLMPLLNALEIEHYPLLQSGEAERPTASMLSHVYALKDIVTAIRAAAIIVHDYKISDYRLEVYGSLDFDRDYVTGCHKLIKRLRLEDNVALRGLGAPTKVPRVEEGGGGMLLRTRVALPHARRIGGTKEADLIHRPIRPSTSKPHHTCTHTHPTMTYRSSPRRGSTSRRRSRRACPCPSSRRA